MTTDTIVALNYDLGRMLAGLRLEDKVLDNGKLPECPLRERADFVKGVLDGLFAEGRWNRAVELVYTTGPVRGLFDGDWDRFKKQTMDAISRDSRVTFYGKTLNALLENWTPQELYDLACLDGMSCDRAVEIMKEIDETSLTPEQRLAFWRKQGDRMMENNVMVALDFYKRGNDTERLSEMYDTVMAEPHRRDDLGELFEFARLDPAKQEARVREVIHNIIKSKSREATQVYEWVTRNKMMLPQKEAKALEEIALQHYSSNEITRMTNKTQLAWAKVHKIDESRDAYQIMADANYRGPEFVVALNTALQNRHDEKKKEYDALAPEDVQPEYLRLAYPTASLSVKHDIALCLEDKEAMRSLIPLYAAGDRFQQGTAYRLWFWSGLPKDSPELTALRKKLIKTGCQGDYASLWWLEDEDTEGIKPVYEIMMRRNPKNVYEHAQKRLAENAQPQEVFAAAVAKVRPVLIKKDPVDALRVFNKANDKDGIGMATEAIAKQYKQAPDAVAPYIEFLLQDKN
jgi:hypothetical protein